MSAKTEDKRVMGEKTLPNGGMVNDRRTVDQWKETHWLVVATDKFMSGWGQAPRRSYYAIACPDMPTAVEVEDRMKRRSEMKRVRIVPAPYRPKMGQGDHLSICWHEDFTYRPGS